MSGSTQQDGHTIKQFKPYATGSQRSKKDLRAKCVNNNNFAEEKTWVPKTPYDIRDEAMNDVLKAYATNFAMKRKEFTVRFKKKRAEHNSITLLAKHWKKCGVFHPTEWGKEPLKSSEPLPEKLSYDARLQRTRLGEFYLCIPRPLVLRPENQRPEKDDGVSGARVIALDPGVRTFCTGYDPSGKIFEIGKNDIGRVNRLCHALDKLQSKWTQKDVRHRKRYKYQRAARRIRKKIRNLVGEFHKKTSRWLCESYDLILLPHFETQQMTTRATRRIGSKSARSMLTWSHYGFRKRLVEKTREFTHCKVILCDESFTSKTCSECGNLNERLGPSKIFKCPMCKQESDRDFNASRNILLRYLTTTKNMSQPPQEVGVESFLLGAP
uniref:Putative transposase R104 n=1 Tax=Lygus hesperus TaxID=30085 RepID=A0A146M4Q7_LYGHE